MWPADEIPEPWRSFLRDLDAAVEAEVRLVCMGGFAVSQFYGFARPTADLDILLLRPSDVPPVISTLGQRGGALHKKHRIYLEVVAVAAVPDGCEERLATMWPGAFRNLQLLVLDPYDLALSKLERNTERDRADVRYLARSIPLDLALLQQRYEKELRWQLGNPEREDLTLRLWLEMIGEDRA